MISVREVARSIGLPRRFSIRRDFFADAAESPPLSVLARARHLSPGAALSGRMCRDLGFWMRRSLVVEPMSYRRAGLVPDTFLAADAASWTTFLSPTPKPTSFFHIHRGLSLLALAGRAYGFSTGDDRLAAAQWINCHPFNVRYWSPSSSSVWPGGRISFRPRFESPELQVETFVQLVEGRAGAGHSFAVVWIPERPVLAGTASGVSGPS
jgi:hypothetical protein